MTRAYHRQPKHDYTLADHLFATGDKRLTNTALMRRISRITGISWSALYARYFTNQWRAERRHTGQMKWVEPRPINYREHLEALKARHNVKDWKGAEGQAILARYVPRPEHVLHTGHDDSLYSFAPGEI